MTYRSATDTDIEFFAEHGWIVVTDAIDPSDLVEIEARCDQIIANKEKLAFDWAWEKGQDRTKRELHRAQFTPRLIHS